MAKAALLEVLEVSIGRYVKDLDAEHLNLGIWNGQVELNSLELDVDAVNTELERQAEDTPNLSLPFRVMGGSFGSVSIDVPWSRLMSQPVVLRAHGLNVSVESFERNPTDSFNDNSRTMLDDFKREKKVLEARIKSLLSANDNRLRKRAVAELANLDMDTSRNTAGNSSFSSRLVRRIIENIQVEVNNVHISLETADGSAGIVMESLSLSTTDARGKRSFVDRTSGDQKLSNSFLHKALQIKGLGIYLDEDDTIFQSLQSISEYNDQQEQQQQSNHSYILAPLSFEATLRQADSNVCIDYPKYLLTSKLPSMSVLLSKSQLEFCSQIAQQVTSSNDATKPLFPEYRPLRRVTKDTAAEWWRYAYRCVGRLSGRRGWKEFFLAFKRRKAYIPLYKRDAHHADCHWLEPLTPKEMNELHNIENERVVTIDAIMGWRNIADAQYDKEQEKFDATKAAKKATTRKSFFFGTTTSEVSATDDTADLPPITLTAEEMKELETDVTQSVEDELSNDSKLCNIHFVLGSFRINLTSQNLSQLASFNMGKVAAAFKANADGSFVFGLKVSSLDITDMVTPNSLFPNVLSSLHKEAIPGEIEDVFAFNLSKTKEGDQKLSAKLVSFQAVASPILLKEIKKFFTLGTRQIQIKPLARQNPILAKSLTGSVDLFYDASDGVDNIAPTIDTSPDSNNDEEGRPAPSAFSNALIEAWKSKAEAQVSWVVDLDIRAPILVLPENCVSPSSNVLVLDLGHLRLEYGTIENAAQVQDWFKENPKGNGTEPAVDSGKLAVTNLTFMVTETDSWRKIVAAHGAADKPFQSEAVVDPISIAFDFAVESVPASELPRACTIGIVPSIVLRLSPAQASRMLNVYNAWKRLLSDNKQGTVEAADDTIDFERLDEADLGDNGIKDAPESSLSAGNHHGSTGSVFPVLFFSIWLQRLSIVIDFENEGGVDAHLVSVNASMSSMSDESSTINLSMGWFWILDRFIGRYARRQRLLAHSSLPLEPHLFAVDEKYAILEELERQGVFKTRTSESAELANITYRQIGLASPGDPESRTQFEAADPFTGNEQGRIDAKFSSLFIHWNPQAIKMLTAMLGKFQNYLEASKTEEQDALLIVSGNSPQASNRRRFFSGDAKSSQPNTALSRTAGSSGTLFVIHAEMKSFEVSLHSARDDLPLFVMTMSRAKISTLSSSESDLLVSLALGDCCLQTPATGETQAEYRTLLGLAPALTESLLCVKYYSGSQAIQGVALLEQAEKDRCEAFADVELSPMRLVYIHAQVLALVEYVTEGILGAIAAKAASSAVAAAADMATASEAMRRYHIRASAFDFVLPQSARNLKHISIHTGDFQVVYKSLADPAGSEASVSLSDVTLCDSFGEQMQEAPVRVSVQVKLPSTEIGTLDEQAMQVEVDISKASFKVAKSQYGQIMLTLDQNLGDYELYLRDENCDDINKSGHDSIMLDDDALPLGPLTHAGVAEIIIPRRMYIMIKISVLSLELFASALQPIIRIAAVEATIDYRSLFDQAKKRTKVTLGNLVCDDQRQKAVKRQYQSLIYQVQRNPEQIEKDSVQDVFYICYESMENGDTNYEITLGSPRIVWVPDVVAELLSFITVKGRATRTDPFPEEPPKRSSVYAALGSHVDKEHLMVGVDDGGGVEVSFEPLLSEDKDPVETMSLSISTSRCSIVLVDLGGDLSSIGSPRAKSQTGSQVVENLVMEGRSNAKLVMASSKHSGETTSLELSAHGEAVEIYTAFGRDMRSPLQILEPAEFSMVVNKSTERFELRAAALTPFNICFSMRNYALISALLAGMGYSSEEKMESVDGMHELSAKDALRIEQLASKLDNDASVVDMSTRAMESVKINESFFRNDSTTGTRSNMTYAISVKVTLPEVNLTVVNDLQGLDDALFRITIATFVAGGELRKWLAPTPDSRPLTTFDCHVHASVMADYFDSSVNLWRKLLTKSWELGLRGARGASKRFESDRLSTTFDIESFPCCLSFSEQFVVSIAAANRMWNIYAAATSSTTSLLKEVNVGDAHDSIAEKSAAASAARNLVTTLPYALENHFGLDVDFKIGIGAPVEQSKRRCPTGTVQYFRFEPPPGLGSGGERLYGQDVLYKKSMQLFLGDFAVTIEDLDDEVGKARRSHVLGDIVLFTNVEKEGKTRVLHLSSAVNMQNNTSVPVQMSLLVSNQWQDVGICGFNGHSHEMSLKRAGAFSVNDGILSKQSKSFGIPVESLDECMDAWKKHGAVDIVMKMTPQMSVWAFPDQAELQGRLDFHAVREIILPTDSQSIRTKFDVQCRSYAPPGRDRADPLVLQVTAEISLIDGAQLFLDICVEPRSIIVNNMPISLSVRTPMPHTISALCQHDNRESLHEIAPGDKIEIFTPGPSIAVDVKCADMPTAGTPMGWMESWVDLPLTPEFGLADPLRCVFPFHRKVNSPASWGADGLEFFIADGNTDFSEFFHGIAGGEMQKRASTAESYGMELVAASDVDSQRIFFMTVCNYGVDHTGTVLFEQFHGVDSNLPTMPYSTFVSQKHQSRVTPLPRSTVPFRLLHLTMDGDEGVKRTLPFKIDNIAICEGGVSSTEIPWEDETPSGYFAYRKLVTTDQSELHIIPEFIIYNGSESHNMLVRQPGCADISIPSRQFKPVWVVDRLKGLILSLEYTDIGGFTPPLRVDSLGLRVAVLKSFQSHPLGSIAMQTVIGAQDSRFVIKVGDIKRGSLDSAVSASTNSAAIDFKRDFLRFRLQASELEVTLNEYKKQGREHAVDGQPQTASPKANGGYYNRQSTLEETPVCTLLLQRFTVDWQRVFKDEAPNGEKNMRKSVLLSPERSQLSLVVHSILLRDEADNTSFPIVFNSSSSASFLDLCIRVRGPLDSDLIKVDLIDLNLAHINGEPQKCYLNTSENFVWKILDLVDRISGATAELASAGMKLTWDTEHGGYVVSFDEKAPIDNMTKYSPPRTGSIYDINKARVSPFSLILTFKRNPQAMRYSNNVSGGQIVKYFTQRLKFKIENAELAFGSYETTNLKGPSDRLVEVLQAVYLSRLKMKMVSIMTASSFQDWKSLANREDGDDTFMEGDLARVTGNLAGKTANMVFKNAGRSLGKSVYKVTNTVGNSFEHATGKVGARQFGAGVNSIISGVGGGLGDGITGVGHGAGKAVQGVGKGAGQLLGGVTGGVLLMGKGVAQGLGQGDVRKIGSGISQGLNSVGTGVGQGVGTAVTGAADGFLSVGKGLFSGVRTVGKGFGGAFTGGKLEDTNPSNKKTGTR